MNWRKTINFLAYSTIVLSIALAALFGYWLNQPDQVVKLNKPIAVVPPEVSAGGFVQLDLDYCKRQGVNQVVRTSFVSKSVEVFQPQSTNDQKAGCYNFKVPVLVPSDLSPGVYRIKFRSTSTINPFKTVVEEFMTEEFTIK